MASIYSRDLKNNLIRIKPKIFLSKFIPNGLEELIEQKVPCENYILGVTYSTGDSQICISGHPKENETILEGLEREVREELALICKNKFYHYKKIGLNTFYHNNISNMKIDICDSKNEYKDLPERVVVCIYGKESEILSYLSKVNYKEGFNEDQIK